MGSPLWDIPNESTTLQQQNCLLQIVSRLALARYL